MKHCVQHTIPRCLSPLHILNTRPPSLSRHCNGGRCSPSGVSSRDGLNACITSIALSSLPHVNGAQEWPEHRRNRAHKTERQRRSNRCLAMAFALEPMRLLSCSRSVSGNMKVLADAAAIE